jgi:hypothetical protein
MAIKHFIKEIGRGAAGARSLTRAQAQELMGAVLAGETTPLELGAMVMALRMKGESLDELCGFLDAVHGHCLPLHSDQPVVVIPSYNGARRLPNLTPLLALLLAQQGVRVLVHGALHEPPHEPPQTPARVTTACSPRTTRTTCTACGRATNRPSCPPPPCARLCKRCSTCAGPWACAIRAIWWPR